MMAEDVRKQRKTTFDLFDDVVGQQQILDTLRKIHESRRYPNALMFYGKPGVGKSLIARRFAAMVVAEYDPVLDDVRQVQQLVEEGDHPDVCYFRRPDDEKSFKIDLVREAIAEARKPCLRSDLKVVVLEDIHNFPSYQQSDALLKAVEDDAENTLFIFTTDDYYSVLETLRSRCTPIQFPPLSESELKTILSDYTEHEHFDLACRLADGSLEKATRFLEPPSEDRLTGHQMRVRAFRLLSNLDKIACHALLKFIDKTIPKDDAALFGDDVVSSIVRDVFVLKGLEDETEGLKHLVHRDRMDDLKELADDWELEQVTDIFGEIREFHDRCVRGSGLQMQHHLKSLMLQIQEVVDDE